MRRWFQFYGQALIEILICGILGIIVALLADHYYFHWNLLEKSFGSFRSSEEVVSEGEADTESSPLRYLVNRRYDGTGSEYVYTDADEDLVVTIRQDVDYRYHGNEGDCILEVETRSYNSSGEVLYSNRRRVPSKQGDTSVVRGETVWSYRYDDDKIYRSKMTTLYASDDTVISLEEEPETQHPRR